MFGHIVSGEHYTLRQSSHPNSMYGNRETQNGVNRYYKEENKGLDKVKRFCFNRGRGVRLKVRGKWGGGGGARFLYASRKCEGRVRGLGENKVGGGEGGYSPQPSLSATPV